MSRRAEDLQANGSKVRTTGLLTGFYGLGHCDPTGILAGVALVTAGGKLKRNAETGGRLDAVQYADQSERRFHQALASQTRR